MGRRDSGNGRGFDPNTSFSEIGCPCVSPHRSGLRRIAAVGRVEHLKAVDLVTGRWCQQMIPYPVPIGVKAIGPASTFPRADTIMTFVR